MITIQNLTFAYPSSHENVFEDVSLNISTDWRLGLTGRNGRGKTTLLKLLLGELEYSGSIVCDRTFIYFPFIIPDMSRSVTELAESLIPNLEEWRLLRETALLGIEIETLYRPVSTLSGGERTKCMLAILFLKEHGFPLIDEPTNHLDAEGRAKAAEYLKTKKGFILVSHDRALLDGCIDHVISINRDGFDVQSGNFSDWQRDREYRDNFETAQNEKLRKDIKRLDTAAKRLSEYSSRTESSKYAKSGGRTDRADIDRGFVGHKAAKVASLAQNARNRKEKAADDKGKLLKNIERADDLKLTPLPFHSAKFAEAHDLALYYGENMVCGNINFTVNKGGRIAVKGKNGCGKSTLLKFIMSGGQSETIKHTGLLQVTSGLKISYVSQETSHLRGLPGEFAREHGLDANLFRQLMAKLDVTGAALTKPVETYSEGQKKKVLLAKSLCEQAHMYIWDEPLNFIDVLSRIQIENLLVNSGATLLFTEHDSKFAENTATDELVLA